MIALLRRLFGTSRPAPEVRQAEIMREVDEALARDPVLAPVQPVKPEIVVTARRATLDRAAFFAQARTALHTRFTKPQVDCIEMILDTMAGDPVSWVSYALATAWHETGGRMVPNTESLNYSVSGLLNTFQRHRISRANAERLGRKPGEPPLSLDRQRQIANILYGGTWGRDNLGNTEPNDGWTFRGRGLAHDTGRRNYRLSGEAVGIDLVSKPERILEPEIAVRVMVSGMREGRYTTHSFVRHLPVSGPATATQFGQARRIINGQDRSADIAANALAWQGALRAGGWR